MDSADRQKANKTEKEDGRYFLKTHHLTNEQFMRTIILTLLLLPFVAFTQIPNEFGSRFSNSIPEKFKLNVPILRNHIYSGISTGFKKREYAITTNTGFNRYSSLDEFEIRAYHFADHSANEICNLLCSGQVYSNWAPLENYLNEILRKIMPEELKNDSVIHVYVLQDGNFNAFMTPSGHAFIQIILRSSASVVGLVL